MRERERLLCVIVCCAARFQPPLADSELSSGGGRALKEREVDHFVFRGE